MTPESDGRLYINRELSWLAFNERVLAEARDASLPLHERLRFLTIVASNLDEFFMVRVAGLKQQLVGNVIETGPDGLLPGDQLAAISAATHRLVDDQYRLWNDDILPALAAGGVRLTAFDALSTEQRAAARSTFVEGVFPALTPLAVDPGHPFPHLRNKSINVAVLLRKEGRRRRREASASALAVVQVPAMLRRLVPVPAPGGEQVFVLLGDLIAAHAGELFPGFTVDKTAVFRVTRNWDLHVDEEDSEDLLSTVQEELRRRDRGAAVRLELGDAAAPELEQAITAALKLGPSDVYRARGPLQLADMAALSDHDPRITERTEPLQSSLPAVLQSASTVFDAVGARDLLLHHPYDSFDPVVRFLSEAAEDPGVLAIKQTLYRTSGDSPFVRALSRAAENGKQVTAIVEIKARFDEANNIAWAGRLEQSGVHVVYGLMGMKTHCKCALVVRREGSGIRRYVHMGTGNYNPQTARQYTDVSLFTAREELGEDVSALFNMLTGYADPPRWRKLVVAPFGMREHLIELIGREAERARRGEPARIQAKMNSLADPAVIRALYQASRAGCEIDLCVRGICCLRPGVPGVSERIRVVNVVDRFLEHSRVYAFGAPERVEVFVSSADWMPRNFLRRVEVMFPVDDPLLRARLLHEVLGLTLADTVKGRRLQADGSYAPVGGDPVRSQAILLDAARRGGAAATPVLRQAPAPEAARNAG